jgi:UDP-N-acetylglucosamine acyltransferase
MSGNKIHKTAIISEGAQLSEDVEVGPYSVLGPKVKIGPRVKVGSSCLIDGNTSIGGGCAIYSGAVVGSPPQDLKYKGEDTKLVIGENNIIREFTTINTGTEEGGGVTRVGSDNLIMAYSHIAHDCAVGDNCVLANCATLAGHVTIEDRAVIGGLVAIHQFCRVGKLSIVGGCSKVVQDIPPFSMCDGHPAKVYGLNLIGLRRARVTASAIADLKSAYHHLFFSGLGKTNAIEKVLHDIAESPEIKYVIDFVKASSRGIARANHTQEQSE